MSNTPVNITSPVGRLVMGSMYKPRDKDAEGKPLLIKNGPNAGQPRVDYFFALAIPKGAEQHWAHTDWGRKIWEAGAAAFPQACQSPAFAWKIEDGNSAIPNKKGRKPCDNEGWAGHWVLKFGGGFAPKIYRAENGGYVQVTEQDFLKLGYYAQVNFNVSGNNSQSQPGIYLNHSMVCFSAYGPEIVVGPDVNSAGFGGAALPAGASATPPAAAMPMPGAGAPTPPPLVPGGPGSAPAAGVTPPPGTVSAPPAAPVPPAAVPAGPRMTAKAGGATYEQFRSQGWTDEAMISQGYMEAPAAAVPPLPGGSPAGSVPTPSAPVPGAPAGIPVTPNTGFVQMPPPVAPVAPPAKALRPGVQGTYQDYINAGWTDAQLVQNGLMDA
jgi:hypothetical protein